jgi:arabinofuranan 3-O-arabinosyltransferase
MLTSRDRAREHSASLVYVLLAALCYVPLLVTARGRVASDTRQAVYLDPGWFLSHVLSIWDPSRDLGTVAHQNVVLVFPMGVYYWFTHLLGFPMWIAQRLWLGSVLFGAALGVLYLARTLRWQGLGPVVAAVVYAMSPYVLQYGTRTSVLLLPWAALPWLVALTERSLRTGGWRHPALFALVTMLIAVNATSAALIMVGPALWIVNSVLITKEVAARDAWRAVLRIAVLTALTSLWWVVALVIEGRYGLPLLSYTETIEQVALTSSATEVLRGLGYWVPYLSQRGFPEVSGAHIYLDNLPVIALQFTVVLVAFLGIAAIRWRYRFFFVAMIVAGVVIGIGAYPVTNQSPLGSLFIDFARTSNIGLALRSTTRAAPLALLGIACILGASVDALRARVRRTGLAVGAAITLIAIVLAPSVVGAELVDPLYSRAENVPTYWEDALSYADAHARDGRLLEIPGSRYAAYQWGNTYEPITYGLAKTPTAWREQIPYGGAGSADLLVALDNRIQAGLLDPAALAPVARVMGASELVFRNDLDSARYGTVPPDETRKLLDPLPAGLEPPAAFGPPVALASAPAVPSVAVVRVQDPPSLVEAVPASGTVLLDGDGDGLVDAAGAGALDGRAPILYAATTSEDKTLLQQVVRDGARIVLTDTNRRRVRRWRTVVDTTGITLRADQDPAAANGGVGGEAPLDVFTHAGSAWQTVVRQAGLRVSASSYGDPELFQNGFGPAAALDGSYDTSWQVAPGTGENAARLVVDLARPLETDHITISTTPNDSAVTAIDVRFDDGDPVRFTLDPARSRAPASQELKFSRRAFSKLTISLAEHENVVPDAPASAIGIAELGLDGRHLDETVRLPTALVGELGASSTRNPLSIVLTRKRGDPQNAHATEEESRISREFRLPAARAFSVGGQARVRSNVVNNDVSSGLGVCRSDLLTVDGAPVPVRVDPPVADARSLRAMSVVGCRDLQLSAGRHELRTDPGSGLDIDQLVLASEAGGTAATIAPDGRPVLPAPASPLPSVSRHNSSTSIDSTVRFTGTGAPAWLILRESLNAGWQATAEKGKDPTGAVLINGFANGWYLNTERTASDTFALRWTPQRAMDIALILSALGIVGALVLAIRGRRWSPRSEAGRAAATDALSPELDAPWSEWPPASLLRVGIIAAAVGVVSALVIAPAWGVGVAALIAIAGRWKHGHALLTGTALGGLAIAFVTVLTQRASQRDVAPNEFFGSTITAHRLAMAAIALLAADVLLTAARRLGPTRDPFAHIHARTDDRHEPAPDATTAAVEA